MELPVKPAAAQSEFRLFAEAAGQHAAGGGEEGLAVGIGHGDGGAQIHVVGEDFPVSRLAEDGGVEVGEEVHFQVLLEAHGDFVVVGAIGHVLAQGEQGVNAIG